ncbi:MAG: hypothetical protein ACE5IY_01440 [bacterium]
MFGPSAHKRRSWQRKAADKNAVVPRYFEVSPYNVLIVCGKCTQKFQRNLIPNVNEPVFVCPSRSCQTRNWVPVTYKLRHFLL